MTPKRRADAVRRTDAVRRKPLLLLVSLVLLGIAIALLILSATFEVQPVAPGISVLAQPSPPWDLLPTRVPTPTETPIPTTTPEANSSLRTMHLALLRNAFEVAETAWEEAVRVTPEDSPHRGRVMREGARLALLRGDLDTAEVRVWDAVRIASKDAETWALAGVILARQGETKVAELALRIAETLDPGLAPDVFADRWRAARQARDGDAMMALAQTYSSRKPENPLGFYYRAAAMLTTGESDAALRHLLIQLSADPDSPAVLWYTLGETYLVRRGFHEAMIVFDVAEARFTAGDHSLYLASDDPLRDLNLNRGRALLGISDPDHCAQAETVLRQWGAPADTIERARLCQTPTPTLTPWIPVQTATYPSQ
ncbi:MAG: tetratricopeptide repeat protein [Anaerolineae bacterium]